MASCTFSFSSSACLALYMQQTLEQYGWPCAGSRDPTQETKTTVFGSVPSDGRRIFPLVGPEAFTSRSNCRPEMTSGNLP